LGLSLHTSKINMGQWRIQGGAIGSMAPSMAKNAFNGPPHGEMRSMAPGPPYGKMHKKLYLHITKSKAILKYL
jgi:hypothetical protein